MSVLCGQSSCFNREQTAWPSDAQRTWPSFADALGLQMHSALGLQMPTHLAFRCQRTWPSDVKRTAPPGAHTSWCACARVSICMLHRWSFHVTNLGTSDVMQPDATFVWSGNWRLVSFVFVIVVRHVPWWLWWCWLLLLSFVAQSCVYVRANWTT